MDKIQALSQKSATKGICAFLESKYFPFLVGALTLAFYLLRLSVVGIACYFILFTLIFFFCKDTRPALAVFLMVFFSLRYRYEKYVYFSKAAIITYAALGIPLLLSMLYRLKYRSLTWKKKSGFRNMVLLAAIFFVGGVYSEYYDFANLIRAIGRVAAIIGTYLFFAFTLKNQEDNVAYFARICVVVICVICLELFHFYLENYTSGAISNEKWKDTLCLGWAISTITGETMAFLLPAVFHLIYKEKNGWLYWLVVLIGLVGIYFTFCRNALLWGGITTIVGVIVNCFIGKNKLVNRCLVCVFAVLGIAAFIYLLKNGYLEKLFAMFLKIGVSGRGRWEIWSTYLEFFEEYPVFGVGFRAYVIETHQTRVSYAHNTILQMLGSTGIVGLVGYIIHRIKTVKLLLKKPTPDNCFIFSCIVCGLLISMLSSYFCYLYFLIYYTAIMLLIEKSL